MARSGIVEGSAATAAGAASAALAAGGALVALAAAAGVSPEVLLRDPAQQFGFVVYAGFLSISGIFLVIGSAGVTLLAATLVPGRRALLLAASLLSGLIAYDDQFVFHDRIAGVHLGFPGWILMAAYGLAALALLLHPAVRAAPGGLILSGGLLGLSAAVDLALPYSVPVLVAEDLLKLAGYAAWFGFWLVFARSAIRQAAGGIEYVSDARATGSAAPSE